MTPLKLPCPLEFMPLCNPNLLWMGPEPIGYDEGDKCPSHDYVLHIRLCLSRLEIASPCRLHELSGRVGEAHMTRYWSWPLGPKGFLQIPKGSPQLTSGRKLGAFSNTAERKPESIPPQSSLQMTVQPRQHWLQLGEPEQRGDPARPRLLTHKITAIINCETINMCCPRLLICDSLIIMIIYHSDG